jgi:putative DNA methylase
MLLIAEGGVESTSPSNLWSEFYSPSRLPDNFTVLDPFLGGGTSLVEAAKLGGHCIGVDIDPVACFITQMELTQVDPQAIRDALAAIEKNVAPKIKALYRSNVGNESVDVIYNFWVDSVTCPSCQEVHDGHPTFQIARDESAGTQTVVCPDCGKLTHSKMEFASCKCSSCSKRIPLATPPVSDGQFTCPSCGDVNPLHELYCDGNIAPRLFALEYLAGDGTRGYAPITEQDELLYDKAVRLLKAAEGTLPIPKSPIPSKGRTDRRPLLYGYHHYREMFNDRQLYCLGLLGVEIQKVKALKVRQALALAFSQCLATNNMFCGYAFGYRRLTPLFGVHSYRKISRPVEGNVWGLTIGRGSFLNAVRSVVTGNEYMQDPYEFRYSKSKSPQRIHVALPHKKATSAKAKAESNVRILNQSSADLSNVPDGTVDLILTDPPYFDNISYSELSDFYHVWLRKILKKDYCGYKQHHTPLAGALFAGRRRNQSTEKEPRQVYVESLTTIFRECFRVTKREAKLVFTFHHRSTAAWGSLGTALLTAGFAIDEVFPVRSEGRSGFHSYEGSLKWDSVFICSKSGSGQKVVLKPHILTKIIEAASQQAASWRTTIRRSRLQFSDGDVTSLERSFILREFSRRSVDPAHLSTSMAQLDGDS